MIVCPHCGAENSPLAGERLTACLKCGRRFEPELARFRPPLLRRAADWILHRSTRFWIVVVCCLSATMITGSCTARKLWGTYEQRWTTVWDPEKYKYVERTKPLRMGREECDQRLNEYVDIRRRWDDRIVHRTVTSYRDGSFESWLNPSEVMEGPMTPTNKPHGCWETWTYQNTSPFGLIEHRYQFYWYGEPISEGEWHERSER